MPTSAREFSDRLADLLRREHHALAEFLVALAEFDRDGAWARLGHASLFDYLHRRLGLSKGAAFYRMTAARVVREHPAVVEPLREGVLCLTSILELAKVLTAENEAEVLPRFFRLSKREAQAVTAELRPAEHVPLRILVTAVPPADAAALTLATPGVALAAVEPSGVPDLGQSGWPANHTRSEGATTPAVRAAPGQVEPKTAELSRIHLTVPRQFLKKLEAARDALSHSHPGATEGQVIEVGLDLIVKRHAKRRGLVAEPRKPRAARDTSSSTPAPESASPAASPPGRSRHVPAEVMREVWERDGGCCAWPLEGGGVCGSTYQLEYDHYPLPFALGGPTTTANGRILCKPHQDVHARMVYGDAWMDRFTRKRSPEAPQGPASP
jgi:hypothetical protein